MKKTSAPAIGTDIAAFLAGNATSKKKPSSKKDNQELDFHDRTPVTCECGVVNQPAAGGWNCTSCDKPLSLTDRVYHAYKNLQDAQASFNSLEGQLLEKVMPEYREHAENGEFSKTFNLAGQETPGVQVSFKDAFKSIPLGKESALRKVLGEKFDNFFFQKREISLLDCSDTAIQLLLVKLGDEDFKKLFKINLSIGPKPDLDRKQFELPSEARLIVQQYKPALKIRTE